MTTETFKSNQVNYYKISWVGNKIQLGKDLIVLY